MTDVGGREWENRIDLIGLQPDALVLKRHFSGTTTRPFSSGGGVCGYVAGVSGGSVRK